jgi:hypothetical protein
MAISFRNSKDKIITSLAGKLPPLHLIFDFVDKPEVKRLFG